MGRDCAALVIILWGCDEEGEDTARGMLPPCRATDGGLCGDGERCWSELVFTSDEGDLQYST